MRLLRRVVLVATSLLVLIALHHHRWAAAPSPTPSSVERAASAPLTAGAPKALAGGAHSALPTWRPAGAGPAEPSPPQTLNAAGGAAASTPSLLAHPAAAADPRSPAAGAPSASSSPQWETKGPFPLPLGAGCPGYAIPTTGHRVSVAQLVWQLVHGAAVDPRRITLFVDVAGAGDSAGGTRVLAGLLTAYPGLQLVNRTPADDKAQRAISPAVPYPPTGDGDGDGVTAGLWYHYAFMLKAMFESNEYVAIFEVRALASLLATLSLGWDAKVPQTACNSVALCGRMTLRSVLTSTATFAE